VKAREITLAIKAKVWTSDEKRCAWNCPALDKCGLGAECMRLWTTKQNTSLKYNENSGLPPLRCKVCLESEIRE